MNNPFDDLIPDKSQQAGSNPFDDLFQDKKPLELSPADTIPDVSEANKNYTNLFHDPEPGPPPGRLLRENAPEIFQDIWTQAQGDPLTVGPLREHPLRPDLREIVPGATGKAFGEKLPKEPVYALPTEPVDFIEEAEVGARKAAAHVASNVLSLVYAMAKQTPMLRSEEGEEGSPVPVIRATGEELPTRQQIYQDTYRAITSILKVASVDEPKGFGASLARILGELTGGLAFETIPLAAGVGELTLPAWTTGLAAKYPTMAAKIAPIVNDALTFGIQGGLEPENAMRQAGAGAAAGAILGATTPYGRIAKTIVGGTVGYFQSAIGNPNSTWNDRIKNAAIMATFGALSAQHGLSLSDTISGTIVDYARQIGKIPDWLRRAMTKEGFIDVANQFVEDVGQDMGPHPLRETAETSKVPAILRQEQARLDDFIQWRIPDFETLRAMGPEGLKFMATDMGFKSPDEMKLWYQTMAEVVQNSKSVMNQEKYPAPTVQDLIDYARRAGPEAQRQIAEDLGFSNFDELQRSQFEKTTTQEQLAPVVPPEEGQPPVVPPEGNSLQPEQSKGIIEFRNVGPDTTTSVQKFANTLLELAKPEGVKNLWRKAVDFLSLDPVPRMARIASYVADRAVEQASARIAAPMKVDALLSSIFPESYLKPDEMSKTIDIIIKDNILGGWDEFNRRADEAWNNAQAIISSSHDAERQKIYDLYVKAKEAEGKKRYDLVERWLDKAEAEEAKYDKAVGDVEAAGKLKGKERSALKEYFAWKKTAAAISDALKKSTPEFASYEQAKTAYDEARKLQLENAKEVALQDLEEARNNNDPDAYLDAKRRIERIESGKLKSNNEVAALLEGYRNELAEAQNAGDEQVQKLAERRIDGLLKDELEFDPKVAQFESLMDEARSNVPKIHNLEQYENDVRSAMNDPVISGNIERWKQFANPLMDQLYNEMKGIDPNTQQHGRGRYFDARINLTSVKRAEELSNWLKDSLDSTAPIPTPSADLTAPKVRRDPFDRAATFTGEYSADARLNLLNSIAGRWNEVTKLRLYNSLVESGAAAPIGSERPEMIQGMPVRSVKIEIPFTEQFEDGGYGKTKHLTKTLYVRADIEGELRSVLGTDMPLRRSGLAQALTTIQILQLADGFTHIKNILTVISRAQGTGSAWSDIVRKMPVLNSIDSWFRIYHVMREIRENGPLIRQEVADMAEKGLIRPEYPYRGIQAITRMGEFIHAVDTASRVLMNRFFNNLVERNLATDTTENKRGFINQVGQYNRRLMDGWMKALKDGGWSPFIVAGRNFNLQGIRAVTGDPGITATSTGAALQMRLTNLFGSALTMAAVPMIWNTIRTGRPGGRPGTPWGALDLGFEEDEKGQHAIIDLADLVGLRRGLRVTGLNALIEGLRYGHTEQQIIGQAGHDILTSSLHPWEGPAVGFALSSLFGMRTDMRGNMEIQRYPGESVREGVERARAALEAQNPLVYGLIRPVFQTIGLDQKPIFSKETGKLSDTSTDKWGAYGSNQIANFLKSPSAFVSLKHVYPARSAAEQMVVDILGGPHAGYEPGEQEHAALKRQIKLLERAGKPIPEELEKRYDELSPAEERKLGKAEDTTDLQDGFTRLTKVEHLIKVLEVATPEEIASLEDIYAKKTAHMIENAAPAIKDNIEKQVEQGYDLIDKALQTSKPANAHANQ